MFSEHGALSSHDVMAQIEVEWMEKWHHGVAGVYNPVLECVEWKTNRNGGVAGVHTDWLGTAQ